MKNMFRDTSSGLVWEEICQAQKEGIDLSKHNLYKYLSQEKIDWRKLISKKLLPDEAYFVNGELKFMRRNINKWPAQLMKNYKLVLSNFSNIKKLEGL